MNFEDLKNPELQEKLKAVRTADELIELAEQAGIELTDAQLDCVVGGDSWCECTDYCASISPTWQ